MANESSYWQRFTFYTERKLLVIIYLKKKKKTRKMKYYVMFCAQQQQQKTNDPRCNNLMTVLLATIHSSCNQVTDYYCSNEILSLVTLLFSAHRIKMPMSEPNGNSANFHCPINVPCYSPHYN